MEAEQDIKKMNQEQLEKLAVSYLITYFERDSQLQTVFPTNDKAPGYDGQLNIFQTDEGKQRKKSELFTTFNTKIKGTGKR